MRVVIFGWANSVHVQRWVRGLSSRGLKVRLVSAGGEAVPGVDTVILPLRTKLSYFRYRRAALRAAYEFQPDLIHAHYATGFGWWLRGVDSCPTVLSVWGSDIMDFPSGPLTRAMVRAVFRHPDRITATSRILERVALELMPSVRDRLSVIPFGVEMPDAPPPPPSSGAVRLCFIKVHARKYGPEVLLRAFARALETCPDLELTMAGRGEMTGQLVSLTRELGVADKVDFPGFVNNDSISDFIAEHHAMVMPSVMDSESFGVAVLEAAACGRPVIASRVGGVPEAVVDGVTGILVPPRDVETLTEAILRLVRDEDLRREMGRAGREFVATHYTWDRSLDGMIELYRRVIREKNAP